MKNFFFKFSDFVTESLKIVNPASLLSGKFESFLIKNFQNWKNYFFEKNWKKNPFIFKTKVENWLNFVLEFAQFVHVHLITIPWIIQVYKVALNWTVVKDTFLNL